MFFRTLKKTTHEIELNSVEHKEVNTSTGLRPPSFRPTESLFQFGGPAPIQLDTIKQLIELDYTYPNKKDEKGHTPLMLAIESDQLETFKYLLEQTNPLEMAPGQSTTLLEELLSFAHAKDKNEFVEYLLNNFLTQDLFEEFIKIKTFNQCSDETALDFLIFQSIKNKHLKILDTIYAYYGINLKIVSSAGNTVFHYAAESGFIPMMELLFSFPQIDAEYDSILGDLDELEEKCSTVSIESSSENLSLTMFDRANLEGNTPLMLAAQNGHIKMVKYLIEEKNANYNRHNNQSKTLLHLAAEKGHNNVVQYLLKTQHNWGPLKKRVPTHRLSSDTAALVKLLSYPSKREAAKEATPGYKTRIGKWLGRCSKTEKINAANAFINFTLFNTPIDDKHQKALTEYGSELRSIYTALLPKTNRCLL